MAFNGSGTFQRLYSWLDDRTNGIKVRADRMDDELTGLATGLSNAICKDGQTTITADIPFNNRKITGLGDATSATHALNRQAGDARYIQRPSTLPAITDIADADIFAIFDASASADAGITYAALKADLIAENVAGVKSFAGRSGVVVATAGDYTASQVTNVPAGSIAATTVQAAINELDTEKAPLASPDFTGVPTAPTAAPTTSTTQVATTAFAWGFFPAGTIVVFNQTTPPTGWTKVTHLNDRVLRVTNGTVTDGGATAFSVAFPNRAATGSVGSTTLTESQMPQHDHFVIRAIDAGGSAGAPTSASSLAVQGRAGGGVADDYYWLASAGTNRPNTAYSSLTGGGGSHTHSLSINDISGYSPAYSDVIFASKAS